MSSKRSICKGCSVYNENIERGLKSFSCCVAPEFDGLTCPCLDCIVKPICDVETAIPGLVPDGPTCKKFDEYFHKYDQWEHSIDDVERSKLVMDYFS